MSGPCSLTGDRHEFYQKPADTISQSATHNSDIEDPPVCILWPDKEHQWATIIPTLQEEIPELYLLGDYNPDLRTGPAIWLRCILARTIDESLPPIGTTPIIYLPGVGRSDLRAVEECSHLLQPVWLRGSVQTASDQKSQFI